MYFHKDFTHKTQQSSVAIALRALSGKMLFQWQRGLMRRPCRYDTEIVGSNTAQGKDVCPRYFVLCNFLCM
jgi:hypothetical protein